MKLFFTALILAAGTLLVAGEDSGVIEMEAKWVRINWEAEAKPLDTVVIHHTAATPGLTWQQLSEIGKQRLYEPHWATGGKDPEVRHIAMQSGHYRIVEGRKVEHFCAYHWIVRQDGSVERLLWDDERGWHAGKWEVNMSSLAIVLDGDFSEAQPPEVMISACAQLIKAYEKQDAKKLTLWGHRDLRSTECPGMWWEQGKQKIVELLGNIKPYPIATNAPGQ